MLNLNFEDRLTHLKLENFDKFYDLLKEFTTFLENSEDKRHSEGRIHSPETKEILNKLWDIGNTAIMWQDGFVRESETIERQKDWYQGLSTKDKAQYKSAMLTFDPITD